MLLDVRRARLCISYLRKYNRFEVETLHERSLGDLRCMFIETACRYATCPLFFLLTSPSFSFAAVQYDGRLMPIDAVDSRYSACRYSTAS